MGLESGCPCKLAIIVSAWIAMKSLLSTSPDNLLYFVCFWIMRLRFAQVISPKTETTQQLQSAFSSPYANSIAFAVNGAFTETRSSVFAGAVTLSHLQYVSNTLLIAPTPIFM